jgi:hypothetical protein
MNKEENACSILARLNQKLGEQKFTELPATYSFSQRITDHQGSVIK